jgi:hypothetical protein
MCYLLNPGTIRVAYLDIANAKQQDIAFGGLTTTDKKQQIRITRKSQVVSVYMLSEDTLAADNSNNVAVGIVNKGLAGSGTTAIVNVASAANSTKATGGAALTAYIPNALTVITTSSADIIEAGSVLEVTADVTGTIATDNFYVQINLVDA